MNDRFYEKFEDIYMDSSIDNGRFQFCAEYENDPIEECRTTITMSLIGMNDGEEHGNLGEVIVDYYDFSKVEDTPINVLDEIEQELLELGETICDQSGNVFRKYHCTKRNNFCYLNRIYINKEYRHLGIAEYVTMNMPKYIDKILDFHVNTYFLKAFPTELERDIQGDVIDQKLLEEYTEKLCNLYKRSGYKQIKGTTYFVKIME